jgi:RHS repeat-associated protein
MGAALAITARMDDEPAAANDNAPRGVARGRVVVPRNDHLGTTQVMSNASGEAVWSASYDPFRLDDVEHTADPLAENPLRFPGQYDDQRQGLGLFWANYRRYYDPATGRYIQPDPLGLRYAGWSGHPYAYAENNPIVYRDSRGLRIETTNPTAEKALIRLMDDPVLGPMVRELDRDPREQIIIEVNNPSELPDEIRSRFAGGLSIPFMEPAPLLYNTCAAENAMDKVFGLSISLDQLLAHELGHTYACWQTGACLVQDPGFNDWSLAFENALRPIEKRPWH